MVTKISLTQGLFALVDDEDAEIVNQYKWYTQRCKNLLYAVKAVPTGNGKQAKLFMHTFLTGFKITDHIDGDGLNNCRENLREATRIENGMNKRKRPGTTSPFKGVYWYKKTKRFKAQISVPSRVGGNGKRKNLGYFLNESEAAQAYDNAARELFGDFAALNFPKPGERSAITGEIIPTEMEIAS